MQINSPLLLTADVFEPESLSSWIHCNDSLTDKLEVIKGAVQLEVLSQEWVKPSWWDYSLLTINDNELLFRREIMMRSGGDEFWYARSIIPTSCFNTAPLFFKRLEKESIRNLIFGTKEVQRVALTCYPVNELCLEYYWVKAFIPKLEGTLWVRFAEYLYQGQESFYLVEILLPELAKVEG